MELPARVVVKEAVEIPPENPYLEEKPKTELRITFLTDTGKMLTYAVSESLYGTLAENAKGKIIIINGKFYTFSLNA